MAKIILDSEKELEDFFIALAGSNFIDPATEECIDFISRQVVIANYGIADLVSFYHYGNGNILITVYELKKDIIDVKTIAQVSRYMTGIKQYAECDLRNFNVHIQGIVIAPEINMKDDTVFLLGQLDYVFAYLAKFSLNKSCVFEKVPKSWFSKDANFSYLNEHLKPRIERFYKDWLEAKENPTQEENKDFVFTDSSIKSGDV